MKSTSFDSQWGCIWIPVPDDSLNLYYLRKHILKQDCHSNRNWSQTNFGSLSFRSIYVLPNKMPNWKHIHISVILKPYQLPNWNKYISLNTRPKTRLRCDKYRMLIAAMHLEIFGKLEMGGSINGDTQKWMVYREDPIYKWMIWWG